MPPSRTSTAERSEADACQYISRLVYDRCRIRLHNGKEALIKARLGKRVRFHGFSGLPEYCEFLEATGDEGELTQVVEALTTNYTSFLREEDHFRFLVEHGLKGTDAASTKKVRVWSAACSTGEEPYSIALYLSEHCPAALGWDWSVTASDIATKVLDKAQLGVYEAEKVKPLPQEWLRKYFQRGVGRYAGHYRVKASLAERVSFRQINLIEPYDHPQPFQVIFCRNVMIYFDRSTQAELVRQLCRFLVPQGYLLIGHSESLNGLQVPLRCLRPSIYQKTTA